MLHQPRWPLGWKHAADLAHSTFFIFFKQASKAEDSRELKPNELNPGSNPALTWLEKMFPRNLQATPAEFSHWRRQQQNKLKQQSSTCTVYIYICIYRNMIYVHISVYHVIYHKKRAANEKAAVTMEGPLHCPTQYENMNTRSWKASFRTKYCKDVQTRPSHQHSGYARYALLFQVVPSWPVWECLQKAQTESPMATNSWDDLPVLPAFMSHESQSTTPLTAYIG